MSMLMNPFLAQKFVEERIKNALSEAEQTQMAKTVQKSKETRPFLLTAAKLIHPWLIGWPKRPLSINYRKKEFNHAKQ